jgi:cation:H+ antiporter
VIVALAFLLLGFIPLMFGARWFVEGSASLARALRVSSMVIGLTLVAFGTSMPELVTSVTAALQQRGELVLGNVAGSNLFNILLILGITALIRRLPISRRTTWVEIPLSLVAAAAMLAAAGDSLLDGQAAVISRTDAMLLLLFFTVFIGYIAALLRGDPPQAESLQSSPEVAADEKLVPAALQAEPGKGGGVLRSLLKAAAGAAILIAGARAVVYGAGELAVALGISDRLIAITVVAVGTSLPELVTSVTAALKKETDLAVGNVVGSNIFNSLFVLGTSAAFFPVPVAGAAIGDLSLVVVATLLLFLFVFTGRGRALERWEGVLFLLLFFAYITVSWL